MPNDNFNAALARAGKNVPVIPQDQRARHHVFFAEKDAALADAPAPAPEVPASE